MADAFPAIAAVRITAKTPKDTMVVPMAFLALSSFFIPMYLPTSTVPPRVSPEIRLVIICVTWVPVDTAAMLCAPQNIPTARRSTAPYSACSKFASRNGTVNRSNTRITFPSVKES